MAASADARAGSRRRPRLRGAAWTIFVYELRMLARDKRTILASVVLPVLIMPVFFFLGNWAERGREKRQEEATYAYAVTGPEADAARRWIAAWEPPPAPAEGDGEAAPEEATRGARRLRLEEKEETAAADPRAALEAEELDLLVVARLAGPPDAATPDAGEAPRPRRPDRDDEDDEAPPPPDLPVVELVYRSDDDASSTAADEMAARLAAVRAERRAAVLRERGFPVPVTRLVAVEDRDVATAEEKTGATLGRWAVPFLLMFLMIGGSVAAADTLAGEKERGTLETMLTTAATRAEVVLAKQLVVLAVGLVITLVQVANLLVYVGLEVIELPAGLRVDLSPGTVALLLVLFLPLAALVSSLLLLASGYAKSYKEFQVYFFPLFLLAGLPSLAAVLPGIDLRSAVAAVPIANLSVAVREVMVGERDWLFLALAWAVTTAVAVGLGRVTMRVLSTERLVTAGDMDRAEARGGAELLPRRVWRWYAVMWVLVFLGAMNVEALASLRGQVLWNVVAVMTGGALLVVRRYRLDPRAALAWRAPRPEVWPLALVAGVAGFLTTVWIGRLSLEVFPIPERALEQMTKSLVPESLPLWQLLLFVAVIPAIGEEIAFRGVLLHALHRKLRPVALAVVVALVFGFFHFTLVRMLPTAALGLRMAAIVLITGSIFPAMVWHFANNATAILLERQEVALAELDWTVLVAAVAVEVLVWWWLWRRRRVYPGLLPQRAWGRATTPEGAT